MAAVTHVLSPIGGGEHAICGLADDAFASGDHDTDDVFETARPGLWVTCPECCAAVRDLRGAMKGLVLVAAEFQSAAEMQSQIGSANAEKIRAYARENPKATRQEIADALGLHRLTVIRHLKGYTRD